MADGEIKIDTKLDTSGLDKGIKDLKITLKSLGEETSKETKAQKDFNEQLDKTREKTEKTRKENEKQQKTNKTLNETLKSMKTSTAAATAGFLAAGVAVKKTVDALNDCEKAYQVQRKAEIALQTAAKNNPYLNNESVYNLKRFASELQNMSEVGDEISLQVMSQLAAAGRNEQQIIEIMTAAADMAAVTGQDIASAAQQLNATLNGNAGTLGRQIQSINNLTKEELENGAAIKLVASQYKGAAKETADVGTQLGNAWGDFKENIGRGWNNVTQPVKQFFLDILNDINEATSKTAALKTAKAAASTGKETAADAKLLLDEAQAVLDEMNKNKGFTDKNSVAGFSYNTNWEKDRDDQQKKVEELTRRYNFLASSERYEAKEAERAAQKAADAAKKRADAEQRDKDAEEYIKANQKALAESIKAMEMKAELTGKEIDVGEVYNTYLQSYIDLITKSNGLVTENNQAAKARLALLNDWAEKASKAATAEEKLAAAQELKTILKDMGGDTIFDRYEERNEQLNEYSQRVQEMADKELITEAETTAAMLKIDEEYARNKKELWHDITNEINSTTQQMADYAKEMGGDTIFDRYEERNEQLNEYSQRVQEMADKELITEAETTAAMLKIDEEYARNKKELWHDITNEINSTTQQMADYAKEMGDLMLQGVKDQTDAELAALDEKYEKGELSEEEYYEKQKAIKKKAAQDEYKIAMFQWSASILAATANIAEGVSKAIAQGGVAGLVTGALVGAAGAVQIASIIASKPVPPSFYTGGIIGGANGATMGGDNTYIHARTGEMVLNAAQQRSLWDKLNGQGGAGSGGLSLTVNNTQSGRVDTNVRQQPNGDLIIDILDKQINKGLARGDYDAGFAAMNTRTEGVRIL